MKKLLLVLAACVTTTSAYAIESKMFKVGSWATYRYESKVEGGPGAAMAGGSGDMMKELDMRVKYCVTGEEERDGKDYLWLEFQVTGKKPDVEKMAAGMLANVPPAQAESARAKIAESKKKLDAQPMFTKDGKMKMAMRLLIEKPDPNSSMMMAFEPVEAWKKEGDGKAVQLPDEELKAIAGEGRASKKQFETRIKENGGSVTEELKSKPGMNMAFGVAGMMGQSSAMTKKTSDLGSVKTEEEREEKVVSREVTPVGMEEIDAPVLGKIRALHMQVKTVREFITKTKTKEVNLDTGAMEKQQAEMNAKVQAQMQEEQPGAVKAMMGVGKAAGFLGDPFGRKKKKAEAAQKDMTQQIAAGVKQNVEGMETKNSIQNESTDEIWIFPGVPGIGLVRTSALSQQTASKNEMKMGAGADPRMQAMMQQQMAMQNMYTQQMGGGAGMQPKVSVETVLEAVGEKGAKSEF